MNIFNGCAERSLAGSTNSRWNRVSANVPATRPTPLLHRDVSADSPVSLATILALVIAQLTSDADKAGTSASGNHCLELRSPAGLKASRKETVNCSTSRRGWRTRPAMAETSTHRGKRVERSRGIQYPGSRFIARRLIAGTPCK